MLLQLQNPFQAPSRAKETLKMMTPMSSSVSPFHTYRRSLDYNARKLKEQFPSRQLPQLKELLEELENDLDMASQIIQEQSCLPLPLQPIQEESVRSTPPPQVYMRPIEEDSNSRSVEAQQLSRENSMLKSAFTKLLKKFQMAKQRVEEQEQELHFRSIYINKLKSKNQQMLEESMREGAQELNNLYIC